MRVVVAASSPSRSSTWTVAARIALTVAWDLPCRGDFRGTGLAPVSWTPTLSEKSVEKGFHEQGKASASKPHAGVQSGDGEVGARGRAKHRAGSARSWARRQFAAPLDAAGRDR